MGEERMKHMTRKSNIIMEVLHVLIETNEPSTDASTQKSDSKENSYGIKYNFLRISCACYLFCPFALLLMRAAPHTPSYIDAAYVLSLNSLMIYSGVLFCLFLCLPEPEPGSTTDVILNRVLRWAARVLISLTVISCILVILFYIIATFKRYGYGIT